ncbi:unnamed protein product [Spodoptera exigua]|nr:unnamed protein product [Spodoptera exigua]
MPVRDWKRECADGSVCGTLQDSHSHVALGAATNGRRLSRVDSVQGDCTTKTAILARRQQRVLRGGRRGVDVGRRGQALVQFAGTLRARAAHARARRARPRGRGARRAPAGAPAAPAARPVHLQHNTQSHRHRLVTATAVLVVGLTGLIPMCRATLAACSCAWSPFESRTGHSHATNSPGESRGMSERMYRTRARDDALTDVKLQARVVPSIPTTQLVPLALNIISDIDNTEITYGLMQSVN